VKQIFHTLVRNLAVAATLGLAALATWAVTESDAPSIEAAVPAAAAV
jgi:hypothetical protein